MKKNTASLMLIVILCYLAFGICLHTENDYRVVGSLTDQMYTIEQQIEICDSNAQVRLSSSSIDFLLSLCFVGVPFILFVTIYSYCLNDISYYRINRDSLVSKKVQLND